MTKDYRMMQTTAGYKLVLVVSQPGDGFVRLRKWRAVSKRWTDVQKVSAALVFKPLTDDQLKWFKKATKTVVQP